MRLYHVPMPMHWKDQTKEQRTINIGTIAIIALPLVFFYILSLIGEGIGLAAEWFGDKLIDFRRWMIDTYFYRRQNGGGK